MVRGRRSRLPSGALRHRFRKGSLVQLDWYDWPHGPGKVIGFPGNSVLVKWPGRGQPATHNSRYLRRYDPKDSPRKEAVTQRSLASNYNWPRPVRVGRDWAWANTDEGGSDDS